MQGKKIYFLGIGGIGMSALALHYLQQGCGVSGYDRVRTPLTIKLEEAGAQIHYIEDPALLPADITEVIYTPAIPADHKEWEEICRRGLPCRKRSVVLGEICRNYRTVAVAGTHGKTTVSSMIAWLLSQGPGCNAILGGLSVNFNGNYLHNPDSDIMVTEADEYDRSFHQLYPDLAVVTAWDADHLDVYGTLENMRAAYLQFMAQSKAVIASAKVERTSVRSSYGLTQAPGIEAHAGNIRIENNAYIFDYESPRANLKNLRLNIPGRHNIENAVAAVSVALEMGMNADEIAKALPEFKGVKRRLERCFEGCVLSAAGTARSILYYDDYAHHPEEISASLSALKEMYPQHKLAVFFQPHLYSRTRDLAEGFAQSLQAADILYLTDIYPARELPIPGVDTRLIGEKTDKTAGYVSLEQTLTCAEETVRESTGNLLLVTMGAGNIDTVVQPLTEYLKTLPC